MAYGATALFMCAFCPCFCFKACMSVCLFVCLFVRAVRHGLVSALLLRRAEQSIAQFVFFVVCRIVVVNRCVGLLVMAG